ncbi:MAG: hypothetical protein Kow0042_22060 [Calditrichia bacterium]
MNRLKILLLFFFIACAPKVHFIKVGRTNYPPKPEKYEMLVFGENAKPEKEYKVVGMVFIEVATDLLDPFRISDSKIVRQLKKMAKKQGADAIIDLRLTSDLTMIPDLDTIIDPKKIKYARAKAIVFIKNNPSIKRE